MEKTTLCKKCNKPVNFIKQSDKKLYCNNCHTCYGYDFDKKKNKRYIEIKERGE